MQYRYRAKNREGQYFEGNVEAAGRDQAVAILSDRGLFVTSVVSVEESRQSPADPSGQSRRIPPKYIVAAVILLMVGAFIARTWLGGRGDELPPYNVVGQTTQNAEQTWVIVVDREATSRHVKQVAQQLWDQAASGVEEGAFYFYLAGQDRGAEKPAAELRFNWGGSGAWQSSFSMFQIQSRTASRDAVVIADKQRKGDTLNLILEVAASYTLRGAEEAVRDKMVAVRNQVGDAVRIIQADVVYENYTDPFMQCHSDSQVGAGRAVSCKIVKP